MSIKFLSSKHCNLLQSRNAKSRYNVALIYIKTGDYAKAQDNLEKSLHCYVQLYGHDGNYYTNDALFAIAGVREKLGECYLANPETGNKSLALDHYEESRRLLGCVAPEDAPEKNNDMTKRVDAKIAELSQTYQRRPTYLKTQTQAKRDMQKYLQPENHEDLISEDLISAVGRDVSAGMTKHSHISQIKAALTTKHMVDSFTGCLVTDERHDLLNQIVSKLLRNVEIEDRTYQGVVYPSCFVGSEAVSYMVESKSASSRSDAKKVLRDLLSEGYFIDAMLGTQEFKDEFVFYHFRESVVLRQFETVVNHLGRGNHSTAADILSGLREGGGNPMKNTDFRAEWTSCMIQVADSALRAEKVSLATNSYEAVYDVLKDYVDTGSAMKLAVKGCIKGHKLTAIELESMRDYSSAIEHRERAYKLLLTEDRTVAACQQLLRIAHLHGEQDNYSRGAVTLADAIRRLLSGNKSVDAHKLPRERAQLLGQCYKMRAVCFSKIGKWVEASEQYGELVTFLKKTLGTDSREYNSALIQKAALSVTLKKFQLAHEEISNYFEFAKHVQKADHLLIVDDSDHVLALDTSAAIYLKMGNTDKAIHMFESKLKFVKTLNDSDEMRSDTMYKLGCILAYKGQPNAALPLLNKALDIMRRLYGNSEASVLQTTWAVAVTFQMLGEKSRSKMEYSVILDSKGDLDAIFSCHVSPVLINNSAGKLFAETGEAEKAVNCFRQALLQADLPEIKTEMSLNLANALSAKGDSTKAMNYYNRILKGKKSELVFLALYNKSLLLIKMGEVVEAKAILQDIANTTSSLADGVRFDTYLTLGNVAVSENKQNDALNYFKTALVVCKDGAVESVVQARRHIGITFLAMGHLDNALASFESALSTLSVQEGKSTDLLKADVWNSMSQVYKMMGDLPKAQNYARLCKCF
jgi:tetratricopeptide (TPR) repeat protein